jgi:hypothetical protein
VLELEQADTPADFEQRVRAALPRPHSSSCCTGPNRPVGYLDRDGKPGAFRAAATRRPVGDDPARASRSADDGAGALRGLAKTPALQTVTAAVRLAVENDRLGGQIQAQASESRTLPTGIVTFLLTDIEGSTGLLQRLGDATQRCSPTSVP